MYEFQEDVLSLRTSVNEEEVDTHLEIGFSLKEYAMFHKYRLNVVSKYG